MTIREFIEMLVKIFTELFTYLGPLFSKSEGEEGETPEAEV